jgi:hypothetical protein
MMMKKNIQSLILLSTPSLLFYSLLLVARAQHHQQRPLVITSTDETGDVLLRPYAAAAVVATTAVDDDDEELQQLSQQSQQWIMYDFKPAFPPYDKHKMEELLLMPPTTHRTATTSSGVGSRQFQEEGDNDESSSNDNNTDDKSVGTTTTDEVDEEAVVHQTLWEEGDLLLNVDADNDNEFQQELIEDDLNDNGDGVDVASMNDDNGDRSTTIDTDDNAPSDLDNAKLIADDSDTNNNDKERPQQRHRDVNAKLDDSNIAIPATRPQDADDAAAAPPVGPLPDPIDDIRNLDDSSEKEEDSTMESNAAEGEEGEVEEEDDDGNESIQEQHAEDETTEESIGIDGGIVTDDVNESSESNSNYNEGADPTLAEEEKEKEERINDNIGSTVEQYSKDDAVEDVAVAETIDTDDVNALLEGNSDDNEGGNATLVEEDDGDNDDRKMDQDTKQDLEIEIDATDATVSTEDESSMEPSLDETKTTEEDEEQKINIQYDDPLPPTSSPSSPLSSPSSNNKDANREFVTGLDDVDKLFESVEVPDELDVGADGSSMQDVLVGQALKIITKKVKSLGGAIKVKFDKVATPVKKALPQLGLFGDNDDEDETDVDALFESIVNGNGNLVDPIDADDDNEKDGENQLSIKLNEKLKVLSERMKLQRLREKVKRVKELQLFKSEESQKVFGFTKRKWSQGKDFVNDLLSIFDSDDEDEDDFDLNNIQSLIR